MEQALVTWTEDTWTSADDDMSAWFSHDTGPASEADMARYREMAIKHRKGRVLSTCWVPFRGVVASVLCEDGRVREVPTSWLKDAK